MVHKRVYFYITVHFFLDSLSHSYTLHPECSFVHSTYPSLLINTDSKMLRMREKQIINLRHAAWLLTPIALLYIVQAVIRIGDNFTEVIEAKPDTIVQLGRSRPHTGTWLEEEQKPKLRLHPLRIGARFMRNKCTTW